MVEKYLITPLCWEVDNSEKQNIEMKNLVLPSFCPFFEVLDQGS